MLSNSLNQINGNECIGNSLSSINSNFTQIGAYVDKIDASIASNVTQIVAGSNITISPSSGTGVVTISSTINNNSIILSGINVGTVGASVFKEKVGQNLAFKKIIGTGTNLIVTEDNNTIKIAALGVNGTIGVVAQNLGTGQGLATTSVGNVLPFKSIAAGTGIIVNSTPSQVVVSANLSGANLGNGRSIYKQVSGDKLAFRSLVGGTSNVFVEQKENEIALHVNETTDGINLGTGAQVYKNKLSNSLTFRTLVSSTPNVVITERSQDILIGVQEQTTGQNIGTGQGTVFAKKTGTNLEFKTLKTGNNIQITDNGKEIQIDALLTGSGAGEVNQGRNVGSGAQVYQAKDGVDLVFRSLSAGPGIVVQQRTNSIVISAVPPVVGRGDVVGAFNMDEGNSPGFFSSKTGAGTLLFRSLSGDSNFKIEQFPNTVNLSLTGIVTEARNAVLGTGTGEIFKDKVNNTLEYRTIKAGPGLSIITGTHDVIISSTIQASLDSLATSFKNKIINGNFDIWQWSKKSTIPNIETGVVSTVNEEEIVDETNASVSRYLADRWAFYAGRGPIVDPSLQRSRFAKIPVSSSEINSLPSRPSHYARITLNERAVSIPSLVAPTALFHRIENIFALAGKRMTLSFYARSNNIGSNIIRISSNQCYKSIAPIQTSGSFRLPQNLIQNTQITSNWQRYSATFNVPPISNILMTSIWGRLDPKEIAENSFTQIAFEFFGESGRYIDIVGVQLEEGTIATIFEPRPYLTELSLCRRYFETGDSFTSQVAVVGELNPTLESVNRVFVPFSIQKRTTPLMRTDRTILSRNIGSNTSSRIISHNFSGIPGDISDSYFTTIFEPSNNLTITRPYIYSWAADAEFPTTN